MKVLMPPVSSWIVFLFFLPSVQTNRTQEELRAPVLPGGECGELRELRREIQFPTAGEAQVVVTIHGHDRCWTDRMVLWEREGAGFELFAVFDEGRARAELFRFKGRPFLFLTQSQPSAGRDWTGNLVVLISDDRGLELVEFDGKNDCEAPLPPMGSRFDHSYGGFYTFQDDDLRFEWNVWNEDDSPNFPTGGAVRGTLTIVEAPDAASGLAIVVESCERTPWR